MIISLLLKKNLIHYLLKVYSEAIRQIAIQTCKNERDVIKNKIEIIRHHPESGILGKYYLAYCINVLPQKSMPRAVT